jgi:hypothetical protein
VAELDRLNDVVLLEKPTVEPTAPSRLIIKKIASGVMVLNRLFLSLFFVRKVVILCIYLFVVCLGIY